MPIPKIIIVSGILLSRKKRKEIKEVSDKSFSYRSLLEMRADEDRARTDGDIQKAKVLLGAMSELLDQAQDEQRIQAFSQEGPSWN